MRGSGWISSPSGRLATRRTLGSGSGKKRLPEACSISAREGVQPRVTSERSPTSSEVSSTRKVLSSKAKVLPSNSRSSRPTTIPVMTHPPRQPGRRAERVASSPASERGSTTSTDAPVLSGVT